MIHCVCPFVSLALLLIVSSVWAQDLPTRIDFSGNTADENHITVQGAGFGQYPPANLTFGAVPVDNAFPGATDGRGAVIQAAPGEGIMLFGPVTVMSDMALVRCSARSSGPHAQIVLAILDRGENEFVTTATPTQGSYFVNRYRRLSDFFAPPSTAFQPVIQVINTSATDPLTVYLDHFEIYRLDPDRFYNPRFLDGDDDDPQVISVPAGSHLPVPPVTKTVDLVLSEGAIPLELVWIPPGTFVMGSPACEPDRDPEETQHLVILSRGFYLGKYEVTQAQWTAVMGVNPAYHTGSVNRPVERVSWHDCHEFIDRLNTLNQGTFRLPTEAEWEYACRAGTFTAYFWGDDPQRTEIGRYAWYLENSERQTFEVGLKWPNPWGLYDICGNVMEWCEDGYGPYPSTPQLDPKGEHSTRLVAIRSAPPPGYAWANRSAQRVSGDPAARDPYLGLRLVLEYP